MSSLGPYLRELRERRGVSLEEISRTTRVGRPYLEALEASDLSKLPAPVFTRGFILAYCQALGEPPQEALARYTGRAEAADGRTDLRTETSSHVSQDRARTSARGRGPLLVSFMLLVVLGVALFAVALVLQSGRDEGERRTATTRIESRPEPTPAAPSGVAAVTLDSDASSRPIPPLAGAPEAPSTTAKSAVPGKTAPTVDRPATMTTTPTPPTMTTLTQQEATAALGSVASPYRLIARTTEPTWIRVRTEDGGQSDETIPAGQVREWVSNRPLTISIGNAGGVRLELNGRILPPLGGSGAVIARLVLPSEAP
jgi:cytoskeleton protein RodZ